MERSVLLLASVFATVNFVGCLSSNTSTTQPACQSLATLSAVSAEALSSPIIAALQANGYFDTIAAINVAGGIGIYGSASTPKTIFTPTQAAWDVLATSLGYASTDAMFCEIPPANLKAFLQYNCLPTPENSADIASMTTIPTCLTQNGSPVLLNVDKTSTLPAIRDAACTVIPISYPDITAGTNFLQGTDGLAIPPGVVPVVTMLESNPFLATETHAFGTAPDALLTTLGGIASFTFFVPTTAGLASAIVSAGPTVLGLTPSQIVNLLDYQVATPSISPTTTGSVPTLLTGQSLTINTNGAPVVQSTITPSLTTAPVATILQINNVGSDGNNIYCVDNVLFPKPTECAANPVTTSGTAACTAAAATADTCAAVLIVSTDKTVSESACAFTAATCTVNVANESANCATYGAGDPTGGTICMEFPSFCIWTPPTGTATTGTCSGIGGTGADVTACAAVITGNVTADAANCNAVLDPQTSMCSYTAGTCNPDTATIAATCPALINTDCVLAPTTTQFNSDFCALE